MSEFEKRVVQVLRCLVPGQKMSLTDTQSGTWLSECVEVKSTAITTIEHNGYTVMQIYYNYETSEEWEVYY